MGLDVYAGPLVRYFLGNWHLDLEHQIAEHGIPEGLRAQHGDKLTFVETKIARRSLNVSTADEAIKVIEEWRDGLSMGLGDHLKAPLEWPESENLSYFTRKPDWDGYQGLLLWAAYEDAGQVPPLTLPEDEDEDPALQRSRANLRTSRYPHLLGKTEIWLPGECSMAFRAPDPTGTIMDFGFAGSLLGELADLNKRTWQADIDTIEEWYDASVELGAPLEACARFGFAVFYILSYSAYTEGFPMLLDY